MWHVHVKEIFTYKIKYHVYNQYCPLKYIIIYILKISLGNPWQIPWTTSRRDEVRIGRGLPSVKIYIHPAETHRPLKFLFHIMGRLVPAHKNQCLFNYPEVKTGFMLITRSCLTLTYIMRPWVSCALQYGYMDCPDAKNDFCNKSKW